MSKLLNHFLAMQGRAAAFVEPTPAYVDRDGSSSDAAGEGLEAPQRNYLFANDMVYDLDGPESRAALDEASFNYIAEAQLTLSASWHGHMVAKQVFVQRINAAIEACRKLDQVKKTLFYGRDNNLVALGQEHIREIRNRVGGGGTNGERVIHAIIGIATEAGELLEGLRKDYNGDTGSIGFDAVNIREELGDVFWYMAILASECGFSFDDVMRVNIAKLRQRYPNAFTEYDAENRNLIAERQLLEQNLVAEPTTLITGHDKAVTAAEVLGYLDYFAGQENTAEEVRDFVQEAARMVTEGKTYREFGMAGYAGFVEWCDENKTLNVEGELQRLGPNIDAAVAGLHPPINVFDPRSELHKPIGERTTLMPDEETARQRVRASDLPTGSNVGMVEASRQYDSNKHGLDPEAD